MIDQRVNLVEQPYFNEILRAIDKSEFIIPKEYNSEYFPEFISRQLDKYVKYYESNEKLVFKLVHNLPDTFNRANVLDSIKTLSESIKQSVDLYFNGDIFKATQVFNNSLNFILFKDFNPIYAVPKGTVFYRSRRDEHRSFDKCDMFHVKFEDRNKISTNRYSIPGFPALYLGESTYVCWEESNRYRLRDLWFSRIENTAELNTFRMNQTSSVIYAGT